MSTQVIPRLWVFKASTRNAFLAGYQKRYQHTSTSSSNTKTSITQHAKTPKSIKIPQGPGGRSSVSGRVVTVFGCTGFLGRYVVNRLAKGGSQVITPYRSTVEETRHLKLMGDLGVVVPLKFDMSSPKTLHECIRNSDTVINLIGRDYETKNYTFNDVHVDIAKEIARVCKEEGVKLVHVGALGLEGESKWAKSKALGESAVLSEYQSTTIVRPSWMYGYEDRFLNRMGWAFNFFPLVFPVPGTGNQVLRPVYVGDVAEGIARLVEGDFEGKVAEFYGPRAYHLSRLIDMFVATMKQPRTPIPVPPSILVKLASMHNAFLVNPRITPEDVTRLSLSEQISSPNDNVLTFNDVELVPQKLEEHVLKFARGYRHRTKFRMGNEEVLKKEWHIQSA